MMDNTCVCCGAVVPEGTRDTGNPVYHALSELVGLYVEVING